MGVDSSIVPRSLDRGEAKINDDYRQSGETANFFVVVIFSSLSQPILLRYLSFAVDYFTIADLFVVSAARKAINGFATFRCECHDSSVTSFFFLIGISYVFGLTQDYERMGGRGVISEWVTYYVLSRQRSLTGTNTHRAQTWSDIIDVPLDVRRTIHRSPNRTLIILIVSHNNKKHTQTQPSLLATHLLSSDFPILNLGFILVPFYTRKVLKKNKNDRDNHRRDASPLKENSLDRLRRNIVSFLYILD